MDKSQILQQIEAKYCPMTDSLKSDWSAKSRVLHMSKGDVLVREGGRSSKLWFVVSGAVRAFYIKDGKKICDWFAFEEDFICALASFYSDAPSLHQIDLLSDAVLFETERADIAELCDKYHAFDRLGRLSATETMLRLQEKIVSIQFETAQQRLENLLKAYPDMYQRVPLGDIASYIGIAQETLSRLRANQLRI